ncbi:hypothetical protein A0J48_012220 [Sphaerospermopsis aphanizomenoides BCCUSP55]|uniref:hypothetical protein n=1 Tax=Sphaerospermopsis aphanizomenoides TaxID=459663 RepID=UPI0019037A92|nr:hypothetical protein [Sphaerospermopsis aphanizomenoides]MBK1988294.1 hypothetical protein [Sphaerospermopsis aphanizomenoides BCCUSP55]
MQFITSIFNQFSRQSVSYTNSYSQEAQGEFTLEQLVEILEKLAQYEESAA